MAHAQKMMSAAAAVIQIQKDSQSIRLLIIRLRPETRAAVFQRRLRDGALRRAGQ